MANITSAKKRVRQNLVRHKHNTSQRSMLNTLIKKAHLAIETKDKELAKNACMIAFPAIDRIANKKLIHKNKAARHKRKLNQKLRALALK